MAKTNGITPTEATTIGNTFIKKNLGQIGIKARTTAIVLLVIAAFVGAVFFAVKFVPDMKISLPNALYFSNLQSIYGLCIAASVLAIIFVAVVIILRKKINQCYSEKNVKTETEKTETDFLLEPSKNRYTTKKQNILISINRCLFKKSKKIPPVYGDL
jgi:uncharacterized membrane protein